jgi:hypothetical protein
VIPAFLTDIEQFQIGLHWLESQVFNSKNFFSKKIRLLQMALARFKQRFS